MDFIYRKGFKIMGKRILFISDTIIMPLERGNRKRVYNLINMMRENGCEIDFLFLHTYPEEDPALTKEFIGEDHFITFKNKKRPFSVWLKRKVRAVLEILHMPFIFRNFSIDESLSPELGSFLKKLFSEKTYDVVWCEYIYTSKALLYAPDNVVKVIDTVNAFTFKRAMYDAVGFKDYIFAITKEEEARGLKRADYVVAIQEEEEAFFKTIVPDSVKVVTIGENMPVKEPYVADTDTILFLGSYYVVNREGVKDFINNVLPLLKESGVKFTFKLVGSICKHIPDSDDYIKLGYVEDIEDSYKDARLIINPVNQGTGLNIKSIEAVSQAKPIVTHSVGVRGLKTDKPFAIVADNYKAYADAIIKVLTDDNIAMEMSENANIFMKNYIEKNNNSLKEILGAKL